MSEFDAREMLQRSDDPLVWDLEKIQNRKRAIAFIMQFKRTLCVYSGPVQQLYSNYDIFLPEEEERKMVILPNPHAHHDTFFRIPESAVTPTGLNIIPGTLIGKQGLFIAMPSKTPDEPPKTMPLTVGLHAIMKRHTPERPFLPVLTKGDLREFQSDIPCVHLHKINIERITGLSNLEMQGIIRAITDKIAVYLYPKKPAASPAAAPAAAARPAVPQPAPAAAPAAGVVRPAAPPGAVRPAGAPPTASPGQPVARPAGVPPTASPGQPVVRPAGVPPQLPPGGGVQPGQRPVQAPPTTPPAGTRPLVPPPVRS